MLLHLYPRCHLVSIIAFEDGDAGLQDYRTTVELFGDEVNAGAMLAITGIDSTLVSLQSLIFRQQGGVDIDHPAGEMAHQIAVQYPHKAGQYHQIRLIVSHQRQQGGVILLPAGKLLLAEGGCSHPCLLCADQAIGISLVADDADHLTGNLATGAVVEDCLQVAAVAGD